MKPGNVFLVKRDDDDDFVKVLDFGLVREAQTQEAHDAAHAGQPRCQIMGSPQYMAPEQVQGKAADGRTDVYALGAMLYAMLAGTSAVRAGDRAGHDDGSGVRSAAAHRAVRRPGLGPAAGARGRGHEVPREGSGGATRRWRSSSRLSSSQPDGFLAASDSGAAPDAWRGTAGRPGFIVQARAQARLRGNDRRGGPVHAGRGRPRSVLRSCRRRLRVGRRVSRPRRPSRLPRSCAPSAAPVPKPTATLHVETIRRAPRSRRRATPCASRRPATSCTRASSARPDLRAPADFLKPDYKLERKLVNVSVSPVRSAAKA